MCSLLLTSVAVCCLCGLSSGGPTAAKSPLDVKSFSDLSFADSDTAWLMSALQAAHDDLRFTHEDLRLAHFDLMAARDDLLAFANKDDKKGPPKGKGKKDEAKDRGQENGKRIGDKKKPPHAGPPHNLGEKGPPHKKPEGGLPHKKSGHDEEARPVPHHKQLIAEIHAIRELLESGKKPHDKKDANMPDGPPHEQVLCELRELRKAVEKHRGRKKE